MPEEIDIKKISPELINFALSEKTSEQIASLCIKNGVEDEEQIEAVAYRIIWALLGKLPKKSLALTLERGAKITPAAAQKIAIEANQLFFSASQSKTPLTEKEKPEEKPRRSNIKDTYREPTE